MLQPKRTKFRKPHRAKLKGRSVRGSSLVLGDVALRATGACWLTARQIEAGRRVIARYTRRGGKTWIRVFPDRAVTARAAETRMGSGKGNPEGWIAVIRPGKIIYEINGVPQHIAQQALTIAAHKLPCSTQIITR
uniref:Large ribosomal subunit protein uL16c n=1 Tax=Pseudobryopsis hainanensis TaxID=2320808 RepID=A0A3S7SZE4_9CHLO|nr:ribosomal protein L16 [Pseudobryopsis hainanensis]